MEMDGPIASRTRYRDLRKSDVRKKKKVIGIAIQFLPDEIIVDILSRLPVKMVVRYRLVCKRWRDITLNQYFVDLNLRHSLPLILVADFDDYDDEPHPNPGLNLFDNWWERSRVTRRSPFDYSYFQSYVISQGGLFVFTESKDSRIHLFILNPTFPDVDVRITLPNRLSNCEIYGVFFHPALEEYCSFWKIQDDQPVGGQPSLVRYNYMMLNLGSNQARSVPSFKPVMVSNLLLARDKKLTSQMLLIDNCLYWMLECESNRFMGKNDIMKFDIMSEEFLVIDCPVSVHTECGSNQTHILNIDGILSYILVLPNIITIWRLKDPNEQLWTSNEYFLNEKICTHSVDTVIAVVNGQLAFLSLAKLQICNLMEGTLRKSRKTKRNWWYIGLSYQMSLASLSECKPRISIDQDKDNKMVVVVEE